MAQWSGRHSSRHKGESLDFADYREYVPGDDFRRIDHNLWARLGVLLVRQFEAEEELPLKVVIDTSASMGFYGKLETARTLAGDDGLSGSGWRRSGPVDRCSRTDREADTAWSGRTSSVPLAPTRIMARVVDGRGDDAACPRLATAGRGRTQPRLDHPALRPDDARIGRAPSTASASGPGEWCCTSSVKKNSIRKWQATFDWPTPKPVRRFRSRRRKRRCGDIGQPSKGLPRRRPGGPGEPASTMCLSRRSTVPLTRSWGRWPEPRH